jgi:hypothetical protein
LEAVVSELALIHPFRQNNFAVYRFRLIEDGGTGHVLRQIGDNAIYAEFALTSNMISVMEDKTARVIVNLEAVSPVGIFSGQKITKNKVPMFFVNRNKGEAESYYFYYHPNITKDQLLRYMDVVLLLLFCKGNAQ